jgi:hypothetical protein
MMSFVRIYKINASVRHRPPIMADGVKDAGLPSTFDRHTPQSWAGFFGVIQKLAIRRFEGFVSSAPSYFNSGTSFCRSFPICRTPDRSEEK